MDGGTLFLDEITEMPIGLQAKLLRALQQGTIERLGGNRDIPVDIRVLAATNRDPLQAIAEGKLRADLYYRLNVFRIDLPPLRERISDIPALAAHFLKMRGLTLSLLAQHALQTYPWPGNVRELQNILERAAIISAGQPIGLEHLPTDITGHVPAAMTTDIADSAAPRNLSLPLATEALEKDMIHVALQQTNGNKSRAARLLDISERSLWYKLNRYKLDDGDGQLSGTETIP